MYVTNYVKSWHRKEWQAIWKGFLPPGLWRLLQYCGYRRRYPGAYVSGDSDIGALARIGVGCSVWQAFIGDQVDLGDYSTVGPYARLGGTGGVKTGKFCSIAQNTFIFSRNHNLRLRATSALRTYKTADMSTTDSPDFLPEPITIGNDVWIGRDAKILAGAVISDGCVVGAGAVVPRKTFPPYSILGGVPARIIGQRFSDAAIEELLRMQWWDLPPENLFAEETLAFLMSPPG